MALTKCKECNHDVSDDAKTCPNCGAKVSQKWGSWKKALAVILGLWLIGMLNMKMGSKPEKPDQSLPAPKTPHQEVVDGLKFDFSWTKGGFSSVMLIDATITNNSPYAIKDPVISGVDSANSGTAIDTNIKTVYETIASGKTLKLHEFNMGFIHHQATKSNCKISDFEIVASKQPS